MHQGGGDDGGVGEVCLCRIDLNVVQATGVEVRVSLVQQSAELGARRRVGSFAQFGNIGLQEINLVARDEDFDTLQPREPTTIARLAYAFFRGGHGAYSLLPDTMPNFETGCKYGL